MPTSYARMKKELALRGLKILKLEKQIEVLKKRLKDEESDHICTAEEIVEDLAKFDGDTPVHFFFKPGGEPYCVLSIYRDGDHVAIDLGEIKE